MALVIYYSCYNKARGQMKEALVTSRPVAIVERDVPRLLEIDGDYLNESVHNVLYILEDYRISTLSTSESIWRIVVIHCNVGRNNKSEIREIFLRDFLTLRVLSEYEQ